MTTFVGKDILLKYDVTNSGSQETLALAQEMSVEVDNGRQDILSIGTDTIQEFNWVGVAVSGSLTIIPSADTANSDLGNLFDLVRPSSGNPSGNRTVGDDDFLMEFSDGVGVYSITLTGIAFGSMTFTVGNEEVVGFELPYVAKDISYSYA